MRPANTPIPSAYEDLQINRKIDLNDGASVPTGMMSGTVALKNGFAAGQPLQYWDFGVGKRSASAVYDVIRCGEGPPIEHPLITDTIPGDTDYSPYRSLYAACATAKYNGEIIPSLEAFNDAIDLGLIQDPPMPGVWINVPIVAANVAGGLPMGDKPREAYYRGARLWFYEMPLQEGVFTYNAMPVPTGNVYEVVKPGSMAPTKVIFSQPPWDPADPSKQNPSYSPSWLVVTVTLTAAAAADETMIANLKAESDLVTVGMMNMLTVKDKAVVASATATTNRVNRPFLFKPVAAEGVAP